MKKNQKREFSKTLLVQESALIWFVTLGYLLLAFYCVWRGYTGSIPWLAASVSFPWGAYGVSQVYYYKKSIVENAQGGIKYESVMKELDNALNAYSSTAAASMATDEDHTSNSALDIDYGI